MAKLNISKAIDTAKKFAGDRIRQTYEARVGRAEDEAVATGLPSEIFVRINGATEATTALFPIGFDISTLEYDAPVRVRKENDRWVIITTDAIAGVDFWEGAPPGTSLNNAPVVVKTSFATLPNAVVLADLVTGYLKVTTGTGVLSSQAVPIPVSDGGTGATSFTANRILIGNGTSAISTIATGASGTYLRSNGTVGVFATLNMGDAGAGTLVVGRGGTGATTHTANAILVGNGTSAITSISPSTSGNILRSNGTVWQSVAPSFDASVITSGTLGVARGGTGLSTVAVGALMLGNGTSAFNTLSGTVSGQVVTWNGTTWIAQAPATSGTVTSVGLSLPSDFTVSGSPVTASGTLTAVWASQLQNLVLASPDGSSGTPTFRALVASDIPNLDASKITTGTLGVARGGTGASTFTAGAVLLGNGASAISALSGTNLNDVLTWNGSAWVSQAPTGGAGTVTSVGLSLPSEFTVSGSPVTGSGTLTGAWASQLQNRVFASPNGSSGTPTFRTLVSTDIPNLDASKIVTGTFDNARINFASPGAIGSFSANTGKFTTVTLTSTLTDEGSIGYDSAKRAFTAYTASVQGVVTKRLFALTATSTIASTATETAFTLTGDGVTTLPANLYVVGKSIRIKASGYFSTTGTPTLRLRLYYGSTVIINTGALTMSSGVSNRIWTFEGVVDCYSTGVSGTVWGQGQATFETLQSIVASSSTNTVDTTATQAITLQATWSASSPSNTITLTNFRIFEE